MTGLTGFTGLKDEQSNPDNLVNPVKKQERGSSAEVSVSVDVGAFDENARKAKKVYVSLVDDNGIHVLDFERPIPDNPVNPVNPVKNINMAGAVPNAHLWSADDPYLYTLVVTLVDENGKKIERIAEPQGLRLVKLVDRHLEINGKQTFLNGVAWNEIDPVLGRAITETERRKQMTLMKKAGVNCIRTAHYPFGPDFLRLADEMGFYVIDEIPFGSRGAEYLKNKAYCDELLTRTEATMRRDKNHANVKWAMAGRNKGNGERGMGNGERNRPLRGFATLGEANTPSVASAEGMGNGLVLESGTGNVSFENVEGNVLLTENMAVAGYGGKASGPSGLKSPKEIKMKGSFKVYNASPEPIDADVVPDLTYTHHYGF